MKKILIFDAYPSIRQLLAEELAAEGNLTMSTGKTEFLSESVGRFGPDLVILDVYIRGALHWDLLDELKRRYPTVPILLFTAFHPDGISNINKADGWVRKSFIFEELKQKIAAVLEKKERESEIKKKGIWGKDLNQACSEGFPWRLLYRKIVESR